MAVGQWATVADPQVGGASPAPTDECCHWARHLTHLAPQCLFFLYILKHFKEVVASSEEFLHLSREELCLIVDKDQLNVKEESVVFEAVLRWVAHTPQERNEHLAEHLANLLTKLRLALVHPDYFTQRILSNDLLQNNGKCTAIVTKTMKLILNSQNRGSNATRLARPRTNPTNRIEVYNNRANSWVEFDGNHTWQELVPMCSKRCYVSVALLDGLIYAIGGYDGEVRLETVERYFLETNQWTMVTPMNEKSNFGIEVVDEKLYVVGGNNGFTTIIRCVECFDVKTGVWSEVGDK
uniref:BACK domain-containing protein n=1 Tax=Periophthalmus magnuspinnatus TaxID=409849 RepID=A0A3B4BL20_9GOBI